jgi:hypothetical protein
MSKVAIEGNASGTGTFTIASPNSNTNRTLTLPDSTGTVVVSGTTPSFNGIAFPATQVASAGANTLDDYEEGTWTPVDGSPASLTFTISGTATYIKVGRICTVCAFVTWPSTATGNIARIAGLPFTTASTTENMQGGSISQTSYTTSGIYLQVSTNATNIVFLNTSETLLVNSDLSTKSVRFNATYITS